MLEKISQAAEKMATSASRRQFLGRLGRGAMAAAAALAGLLAIPGDAQAAPRVCRAGSEAVCRNQNFGGRCIVGGRVGTCRPFRGSPGCYCHVQRR
jgi:hypothetical protein